MIINIATARDTPKYIPLNIESVCPTPSKVDILLSNVLATSETYFIRSSDVFIPPSIDFV
jgi:hypothetical protein